VSHVRNCEIVRGDQLEVIDTRNASQPGIVKSYLTVGQIVRLFRMGVRRSLWLLDIQRSRHMNNEINIIERLGQALLAVTATGVTVLALQIAMLAA
jgi:hypothetical protein